ncbi:MAG TPA: Tex family protein [Bacteroidales bacterium]|nr:Tex family protein [Bacteroidales bacterium]HSA43639.1 Tex family protein [Bacteroidales bacterium]
MFAALISQELNIETWQVKRVLELFEQGATIPFIARYRKEMTGSLEEVQLARIRDKNNYLRELEKRRDSILQSIEEQGKLTPELRESILRVTSLSELEDIYLPFRPKRKTRAGIAREKGLEPLAKMIMAQNPIDLGQKALLFIHREHGILTVDEALAGARDIIAEWISESLAARARMRNLFLREGSIRSRVVKDKEEEGEKYQIYFSSAEALVKAPSHRLLAMFRGENEGFLKIDISPPEEKALDMLDRLFLKNEGEAARQVKTAIRDSYKRLLAPSMETEARQWAKEKADREAIRVFTENLRQLLMAPPLGQKNVLALDPGFKSGCKLICLDRQGKLLHNETIFPHPPQREIHAAIKKILQLVSAYKTEVIAIGNGTAGRETEDFIRKIPFDRDITAVMVNESGASVYSASPVAREEFPDYDVTVRGAVSIGRRLQDPLAELVKIDPKSIGVGQYQHDVDQKLLQTSLEDTVISCVNHVGVEVNTASAQLLAYVSGIGPALAKNIIEHRQQYGPFRSREALKDIKRYGDKAFEQSAGFLRIRESDNPLDASAVHPESYYIVRKMADRLNCGIPDLIADDNLRNSIRPEEFTDETFGLPTIRDILSELAKPGRDPRKKFDFFEFDKNVNSIHDLKPGMILPGIVTNITAFGAFVDIGVHQDGLIHISQISNTFVRDPNDVLKINQKLMVKVLDVDHTRKRIQLSLKDVQESN